MSCMFQIYSGVVQLYIHVRVCSKSLPLCPTLCDPLDCGSPGSSVHGILQARILEWVSMPSSRGIFPTQGPNPCLLHLLQWQVGSLPRALPGKPIYILLQILFHYRLLQDSEYSSLRYTVDPSCLSVLCIEVCICKSQSSNSLW